MAKKKGKTASSTVSHEKEPNATLKDLLNPDTVHKLKAQAEDMKAQEEKSKQEERKKAEEARKAEQKRLENNFEHLLNNSNMDWKKYK